MNNGWLVTAVAVYCSIMQKLPNVLPKWGLALLWVKTNGVPRDYEGEGTV